MSKSIHFPFLLLTALIQAFTPAPAGAAERPRLLVLTDIGGDPDDTQSLIRLMLYANEFEIEGLIATAAGTPGELRDNVTKPELIREVVHAYGKVRDNLANHAAGYPRTEQLLDRIKSGNANRGREAVGEGQDTDGSRWIIQVVDRADPRPLNIAIWGGQTDLAQALWRVRRERGDPGVKKFIGKIRVYDISDQDGLQGWLFENFPDLFYVLCKAAPGADKRTGAYRGMYLGGDEALTAREWLDTHVRKGHGPLGELYPAKTWTEPNPHAALKEGDTPSWFYFLPTGLGDPSYPNWGGWGGRFEAAKGQLWRDVKETVAMTTDARASVWRWRPAFQNDFQARMDWCAKSLREANHPPVPVVGGDESRRVLTVPANRGTAVKLSAAGSADPDGHPLRFKWWVYREAGSYSGQVTVEQPDQAESIVRIPNDAAGETIHVILEVTDEGTPPLTRYRRVILKIATET